MMLQCCFMRLFWLFDGLMVQSWLIFLWNDGEPPWWITVMLVKGWWNGGSWRLMMSDHDERWRVNPGPMMADEWLMMVRWSHRSMVRISARGLIMVKWWWNMVANRLMIDHDEWWLMVVDMLVTIENRDWQWCFLMIVSNDGWSWVRMVGNAGLQPSAS